MRQSNDEWVLCVGKDRRKMAWKISWRKVRVRREEKEDGRWKMERGEEVEIGVDVK